MNRPLTAKDFKQAIDGMEAQKAARPVTKKQRVVRNFAAQINAKSSDVTRVSVGRLVSMLDCEHGEGSLYAVVSKKNRTHYVTTVLDVPLNKLYRAVHPTGMACYFKGLGKRLPDYVVYVAPDAEYLAPKQEPKPRSEWMTWSYGRTASRMPGGEI